MESLARVLQTAAPYSSANEIRNLGLESLTLTPSREKCVGSRYSLRACALLPT